MKRNQETDNARKEEDCSEDVKLLDAFFPSRRRDATRLRYWRKEEQDDCNSNAPNGQVDIKAPSPCCFVGEGSCVISKSVLLVYETWMCQGRLGRGKSLNAQ